MKKLLPLLFLSGCTHAASKIVLADGSSAYALHCAKGGERCLSAMTAACPSGYEILEDQNGGTKSGGTPFGREHIVVRDVVFRCK